MTRRSSQCLQEKKNGSQLVSTKETRRNVVDIKEELANFTHKFEPNQVLKQAEKKLLSLKDLNDYKSEKNDPITMAMTLREFDIGLLLIMATSDEYSTFAIDLMRKIQQEYACVSASEKAIAELASASFTRTLNVQKKIRDYLDMGSITGNGVQYLGVLSKDLDRAHHQYLLAIQTLKAFRQPPMKLSIRTNTAVIGQNQMVQTNEINEPK